MKHLDFISKSDTRCFNYFFALVLVLCFSLEVVMLFVLQWAPRRLNTEEMVTRCCRNWSSGQIPLPALFLTSAGVMDLQCFLCWRVAPLILLCKAFHCYIHTNHFQKNKTKNKHTKNSRNRRESNKTFFQIPADLFVLLFIKFNQFCK